MVDKKLKLGIIGVGTIGKEHAKSAIQTKNVTLQAVADPVFSKKQFNLSTSVNTYLSDKEMLNKETLDAVIIASPHHFHAQQAVRALMAGCHIMVEKPMALNKVDCDKILKKADECHRRVMVAHTQHFIPSILTAHDLIQTGTIGKPLMGIDIFYVKYCTNTRPLWFLENNNGGMFWNLGCHLVDRLRWLMGCNERAVTAKLIRNKDTDINIGGNVLIEYINGMSGAIFMSGLGYHKTPELIITGEKGALRATIDSVEVDMGAGFKPVELQKALSVGRAQLEEFVYAIYQNRSPCPSGKWGREIVKVVEAVFESDRNAQRVVVDWQ